MDWRALLDSDGTLDRTLAGMPVTPQGLLDALQHVHSAQPLTLSWLLCVAISAACWLGNLTGYWSWVDRVWSIIPAVYAALFLLSGGASNPRLVLMTVAVCVWAARLTFNFARKGGYGKEEDYRWPILRAWFKAHDPLHPLGRELFSLLFVAVYQNALIWAFTAPACERVRSQGGSSLGTEDWIVFAAFLACVALETVTDEQQWAFQSAKYALTHTQRQAAGGDIARGFRTTGVFRFSRHMNFFAEQGVWWCWYAFGAVHGSPLHWSCVGAALLSMLFLGSTTMTEALSAQKYPVYRAYQQTTSRIIPWLPGPSLDSEEGKRLVAAVTGAAKVKAS